MDVLDKISELTGLKFEDLKPVERETAMNWIQTMAEREIGLEDVRMFINSMRVAVDGELAVSNLSREQDLYLKARLKNLIMLEAFITSPEKAQKALELYLKKLKVK